MPAFIRQLLWSPRLPDQNIERGAIRQQRLIFEKIWQGERGDTYGVERIFLLLLCLLQFAFPILYFRAIAGRYGKRSRELATEAYLLAKLALPIIVLSTGLYGSAAVTVGIIYLVLETVTNIMGIVFFSDVFSATVGFRRSVIILFLSYFEVVLGYAVIYSHYGVFNAAMTPLASVYFSVVTSTTLGYGDFHPVTDRGRMIVVSQLTIVLLFVTLFFNYFLGGRIVEKKSTGKE